MTSRSIGEILGGLRPGKRARTFQPVRRNSYHAGEHEGRLWQRLGANNRDARRLIGARMKAAERYDRQHKAPGKKNGPLGHVGLEVLRQLYRIIDFKTGRLDPAIDTVCRSIRRCRSAVVAAMKRLKEHGFLDWVRRTEPTGNEGAGPQVKQITNAYGFGLPAEAADWVKRDLGNGPPPDCEVARQERDVAETAAMLESASIAAQAQFLTDDPELIELLAKFGSGIDRREREFAIRPESDPS